MTRIYFVSEQIIHLLLSLCARGWYVIFYPHSLHFIYFIGRQIQNVEALFNALQDFWRIPVVTQLRSPVMQPGGERVAGGSDWLVLASWGLARPRVTMVTVLGVLGLAAWLSTWGCGGNGMPPDDSLPHYNPGKQRVSWAYCLASCWKLFCCWPIPLSADVFQKKTAACQLCSAQLDCLSAWSWWNHWSNSITDGTVWFLHQVPNPCHVLQVVFQHTPWQFPIVYETWHVASIGWQPLTQGYLLHLGFMLRIIATQDDGCPTALQ